MRKRTTEQLLFRHSLQKVKNSKFLFVVMAFNSWQITFDSVESTFTEIKLKFSRISSQMSIPKFTAEIIPTSFLLLSVRRTNIFKNLLISKHLYCCHSAEEISKTLITIINESLFIAMAKWKVFCLFVNSFHSMTYIIKIYWRIMMMIAN